MICLWNVVFSPNRTSNTKPIGPSNTLSSMIDSPWASGSLFEKSAGDRSKLSFEASVRGVFGNEEMLLLFARREVRLKLSISVWPLTVCSSRPWSSSFCELVRTGVASVATESVLISASCCCWEIEARFLMLDMKVEPGVCTGVERLSPFVCGISGSPSTARGSSCCEKASLDE
ncbi:hypothetical protein OGAPHI_004553 [Ogataea philodendri]|uniref:Uncharacterized protein n=1 Tax=Ogataea philodendri TaxID=1378263 RepID=A0A9P8P2X6_9ASCO|nr:uncharacterized protein OGAPHI_004553 [Ogataea philodendri]KAH3664202.1 hypothetical protein OGAPHI_004553 [Ogataea philodendri]